MITVCGSLHQTLVLPLSVSEQVKIAAALLQMATKQLPGFVVDVRECGLPMVTLVVRDK